MQPQGNAQIPSGDRRGTRQRAQNSGVRVGHEEANQLTKARRAAQDEYRPGQEQYTLLCWAGGTPGRWERSIDIYGLRRHVPHMAVLAVGYTGLPVRGVRGVQEIASVIAPLELTREWKHVTGVPIARTFAKNRNGNLMPFDLRGEENWVEASAFLAENLQSVFRVTSIGEKLEQHHHVVGPAAIRTPNLAVNLEHAVDADQIPRPPRFVPLNDIEDEGCLSGLGAKDVVFDTDPFEAAAYDVRQWTREQRPLTRIYGAMPWVILPTNIRSLYANLGNIQAHWFLD